VHPANGAADLVGGELIIEMLKGDGPLGVQVVEREIPGCGHGCAKEIVIEAMKHCSFVIMGKKFHTIIFDHLNLVSAASLIRTSMEVARVLIAFNGCSDFGSLFPN
jgi:hypothetical protein